MTPSFIHLRVFSAYSLAEGANRIPQLIKQAVDYGMPALGITDNNNLFGALEFSQTASASGVQPIIGATLSLSNPVKNINGLPPEPDKILLLAKNKEGYQSLMGLLSEIYMDEETAVEPQADYKQLAKWNNGLIALTGGIEGPIGRLLLEGQKQQAEEITKELKNIFGNRLYMEIMRHGLFKEDKIEGDFIDLAYKYEIPLVATNGCYFPRRDFYEAHDALRCIATGTYLTTANRPRLTEEHYFKSPQEMIELFKDLPEAIENTVVIAKRCAVQVEARTPLFPKYTKLDGRSSPQALEDMAKEGLKKRLVHKFKTLSLSPDEQDAYIKKYEDRLAFELNVINEMGFAGYFLIVADFIHWSNEHNIPVGPGRGSGAGSLVAWSLTITALDPLQFGLLFERFLNPERVSMPDFDIDFCQERRDEVIHYVQKEYGRDRVAQIITFGKLQARAVLRDVGRVMQIPYPQVDRICKLIPNNPAKPTTLEKAMLTEPLLRRESQGDVAVERMINIGMQLEGLYRHASTHAAGVVIGDRPLPELVALYRDAKSDMPVTQFNMKFIEKAGLVKFDFLGLKTLTVLAKAIDIIAKGPQKKKIDLASIPFDDKKTYEMLCRGETIGVFQMESAGMRDVIKNIRPYKLEDLTAIVALYRPGPMENIPAYIRRRHGKEEEHYLHPALEPVLKETFGIPIYQEQVMQMAQVLGGYSLGEADLLRRAMGKKIQAEMDTQRERFVAGALKHHGVEAALANRIFDEMNAFAGYGFNKSHAAAYAYIAYQTAWLKANYPEAFMAATMTLDLHNTDKLAIFCEEVKRLGIPLLPPNINHSKVEFFVETPKDGKPSIRYALAALKNVGEGAVGSVVIERQNNGGFVDIYDFMGRFDSKILNKRLLESLVKSGCFDSVYKNRRLLLGNLERLVAYGQAVRADRDDDQISLFVKDGETFSIPKPVLPKLPDWPLQEKLTQEFEVVGFYLSSHPLSTYEEVYSKLSICKWSEVLAGAYPRNKPVKLAGIVTSKRLMRTSKGTKMAFVTLSDMSGAFEVTLFQEVLNSCLEELDTGHPLLLTVSVQKGKEEGQIRLLANHIQLLEQVVSRMSEGIRIRFEDKGPLEALYRCLNGHIGKGRHRVLFLLEQPDYNLDILISDKVEMDAKIRQEIRKIPGILDIEDI